MTDRSKNYWEVLKISLAQQTNIKSGIHQKNVRVQTEQFWVGNFSPKIISRCSNLKETVLHNLNKNFNIKSRFGGNIYHSISLAGFLYRCYSILLNTSFKSSWLTTLDQSSKVYTLKFTICTKEPHHWESPCGEKTATFFLHCDFSRCLSTQRANSWYTFNHVRSFQCQANFVSMLFSYCQIIEHKWLALLLGLHAVCRPSNGQRGGHGRSEAHCDLVVHCLHHFPAIYHVRSRD